jgi:CheY-like chemotaxis protein
MQTILIVDDAPENIRVLKTILEQNDYNVKIANSGKRCLELLEKLPLPDLILLDIMMPEMDGYEVITHLKNNEITKHVPVIFVTTKDETEDEKKGLELGAVDFITKPVNQIITLARVKTHLELYGYSQKLEKMVEEKTKEVIEQKEKLFQQSKLAAMGEMIDAIAHQWQQPISVLTLDIDILALQYESGKVDQAYIDKLQNNVHRQLNHMVSTLNEFRTFLKPNKQYNSFDLKSMFERILLLLQDELIKNKIKLLIHESEPISFYGIENELIHLFINLINNAKDAFKENQINERLIDINIRRDENFCFIDVVDNAGGIPENAMSEIFKANFTTKEEGKGSGIGLYMSSQIAQKYNGKLEVCNVENGAKFTFSSSLQRDKNS